MGQAKRKQTNDTPIGLHLLQGFREGALFLLSAISIFLILSLYSYHANDCGWSYCANKQTVFNLGGAAGAWFSDVFLYLFGYFAYLFPFVIGVIGWKVFCSGTGTNNENALRIGIWILGLILLLFSGTGILHIHFFQPLTVLPANTGGILGQWIAIQFVNIFNLLGTTLFLLALFLSATSIITGISWFAVMDETGRITLILTARFWGFCLGIWHFLALRMQALINSAAALNIKQKLDAFLQTKPSDTSTSPSTSTDTDSDTDTSTSTSTSTGKPFNLSETFGAFMQRQQSNDQDPALQELDPTTTLATAPELTLPKITTEETNNPFTDNININPNRETEDTVIPADINAHSQLPAVSLPSVSLLDNSKNEKPVAPSSNNIASQLPSVSLLDDIVQQGCGFTEEVLAALSQQVEAKLMDFGIKVKVVAIQPGPVVTLFEMQLAPGIKASKITGLSKDLARSLATTSVRVVEIIAGKSVVGLEIPNKNKEIVYLGELLRSPTFEQSHSALALVLGKDISGKPTIVDLSKMPHLLVAGTTGSGKSVAINTMILSLLFKTHPNEVRLIMVDPKMLELSVYDGIPHLLCPVVTDMKEAANALRWCVGEMERRYLLMASLGVRNILGYNKKIRDAQKAGKPILDPTFAPRPGEPTMNLPTLGELPYIVVIIDELADMMMTVGKKVEELIARLAQKARASGIHLILATQRPSVDVITGLIKANIPTRIAFQVSSRIDSRTIIDQMGAENLLGHGDMLYLPPGTSIPLRVHGAFVDDHEVHKVVADLKSMGEPNYIDEVLYESSPENTGETTHTSGGGEGEADQLYDTAVAIVTESRRASISNVQRRLKIGYNRAARLIEEMENAGIVTPAETNGSRQVLAPPPP